jgi:hypothetical protein
MAAETAIGRMQDCLSRGNFWNVELLRSNRRANLCAGRRRWQEVGGEELIEVGIEHREGALDGFGDSHVWLVFHEERAQFGDVLRVDGQALFDRAADEVGEVCLVEVIRKRARRPAPWEIAGPLRNQR